MTDHRSGLCGPQVPGCPLYKYNARVHTSSTYPAPRTHSIMKDLVRDSFIGQLVNRASGGRLLPYPDQRSDYVIPERYLAKAKSDPHVSTS